MENKIIPLILINRENCEYIENESLMRLLDEPELSERELEIYIVLSKDNI